MKLQFALNEYCSWTRGYISNCSQIIELRSFELFYKRKRLVNLVVTAFCGLYFKEASGFFNTFQPGGRFFPSTNFSFKKRGDWLALLYKCTFRKLLFSWLLAVVWNRDFFYLPKPWNLGLKHKTFLYITITTRVLFYFTLSLALAIRGVTRQRRVSQCQLITWSFNTCNCVTISS